MPHAEDEDGANDIDLPTGLEGLTGPEGTGDFGDDDWSKDKGDEAIDYEDISDGDLPEEEEATNNLEEDPDEARLIQAFLRQGDPTAGAVDVPAVQPQQKEAAAANDTDFDDIFGEGHEDNDLFGERLTESPVQERAPEPVKRPTLALPGRSGLALPGSSSRKELSPSGSPPSLVHESYSADEEEHDDFDHIVDPIERAQMELFNISRKRMQGEEVDWDPVAAQDENKFWQQFPSWEEDEIPRFCELLPPVPGRYRGKLPIKPPKALQATKLTLDLLPDQEKSFKSAAIAATPVLDAYRGRNVVEIEDSTKGDDESDMELNLELDDDEMVGGVTMRDLAIICQDWDIPSPTPSTPYDESHSNEYDVVDRARPQKKQMLKPALTDLALFSDALAYARLDDPERATSRLARAVALDMNDPFLLLDEQAPANNRKRLANGTMATTTTSNRNLARRYNISNDEAYDLLKENHQHKVRSTLGSMAIEHSLPAARLQWPFYKVTLDGKERRAFHRDKLTLHEVHGRTYRVSKPRYQKKKHVRGREAKDLFAKAEDLSLGDNSSVLMLEYSEEQPTTLSNFGMGNRILNYYRKRDPEDQERPKRELGEAHILLNQDKSPFANFGHVDTGETVPAIQNGLYRAPIFQHEPKTSDFILAISHTFESGNKLYLRNAENLHVVGQQLPVTEVPGEHSRKVTDAAKKRLRAISYRIYGKNIDLLRRGPPLTNKVLMKHIPGSDIPQTRSKMREFMKYEKKAKNSDDDGYWVPMPGQAVPDPETILGWIRPEDICLLDSTQVGVQHLHDLGISTAKNDDGTNNNEEEELEEGAHIEKQLAPWQTTKNFIAATQGKAMLMLHGEGDPTGRGEGFSFIRTSMKGGYIAEGESVEEKLSDRKRKEQGGHKYNVATQQAKYDASIRTIWDRQKASLTNDNEMSESEIDDDEAEQPFPYAQTPRTTYGTPAASGFDDSASQFSKQSEHGDELLVIRRANGSDVTTLRIDNPRVIKLYRRRKQEAKLAKMSHKDMKPTGNEQVDNAAKQELLKELARLQRNAERREAREKQKDRIAAVQRGGVDPAAVAATASSPGPESGSEVGSGSKTATPAKPGKGRKSDGTARKCANCGQVGHIKTNRKLCPMLNGTWNPEDAPGAQNSSFGAVPSQLTL